MLIESHAVLVTDFHTSMVSVRRYMSMSEESETGHENFSEKYDAQISIIEGLPALPDIIWDLQAVIQSAESSSEEIAMVIEQEPSLATNLLRLANSPFHSSGETILSIADAVTRVGIREIENLVGSILIIDTFREVGQAMDHLRFWGHSLDVASAAEGLADRFGDCITLLPQHAFISGLVHDLGKLILDQYFPEEYERAHNFAAEHGVTDSEAERQVLGIDHGEIFGRLIENWSFEPNIIEAVRFHHAPETSDPIYTADAQLIQYADAICHYRTRADAAEEFPVHSEFPLDAAEMESLIAELDEKEDQKPEMLAES
jgi:HD-like signal output (HDOD) protein